MEIPDLRKVIDNLPDPFAVFDPEWRFAYINPTARAILGEEDMIGLNLWDRFPDTVGSEFYERLHEAVETGEPVDLILRPEQYGLGTEAWFHLRACPVPEGLAIIAWDATFAKQSEEEREELLRSKTKIARVLQRALLPPALPEIPGAEVSASYVAAEEGIDVGGDFYDVFAIESDGWALVMGDVTGKGPEAAALTSLARYTIRAAAMRVKRPKRVLSVLNEEILRQTGAERLFTAVYAELEPDQGGSDAMLLRVACAGHPSPLILRKGGEVEQLPETGTILGVVEEPEFAYREVTLQRGESIVFYTDGVIEARSRSGEFFGEERLLAVAEGSSGLSAADLSEKIKDVALDFQDGNARDDIAVLVLRVGR